jgi:hypothetical protein
MIPSLDFLVVLFIVDSLALVSLKEYRSVACMTKCADAIHSSSGNIQLLGWKQVGPE